MDEREAGSKTELACARLGELAATVVPSEDRAPDARQWAAIATKLDRRAFSLTGRRPRWRLLAFSGLALACALVWFVARRTLDYRVESCTVMADGALLSTGAGAIAFSDGSNIQLEDRARVRVKPFHFAAGAELSLDEGEAKVSVRHRVGARWAVLAGPFRVEVTGTRFSVRWSGQRGLFRLALLEGEVRVSGGTLAGPTLLRPGQTLEVGANGPTAGPSIEPAPQPRLEENALERAPTAPAVANAPPALSSRSPPTSARRRNLSRPASSRTEQTVLAEATEPTRPASASSVATPAGNLPTEPLPTPAPVARIQTAPRRITINADGSLGDGMTGYAYVSGGEDTTFSTPVARDRPASQLVRDGRLCASGTIAGLRCVNEKLPQVRCNWDSNWGVIIGVTVRADLKAWDDQAAGGIAVEFHGRSNNYRLTAHRSHDPAKKIFCIDNYKSGAIAKPAMFKSECWADQGEALSDFKDVDRFTLQLPSSPDYMAFRYCILGVQLFP